MGFYYSIQPKLEYLKYTQFDNLKKWLEAIKDKIEDPIVKCNGCNTDIKNTLGVRHIFDDIKYYACNFECKLKVKRIHQKAMKEDARK